MFKTMETSPFLYDYLLAKISIWVYPEMKFSYPDNTAMKFTNLIHTLKRANWMMNISRHQIIAISSMEESGKHSPEAPL